MSEAPEWWKFEREDGARRVKTSVLEDLAVLDEVLAGNDDYDSYPPAD